MTDIITQKNASAAMAFFGMELGGDDIVFTNHGGEQAAVVASGNDMAAVGARVETMGEVKVLFARHVGEQPFVRLRNDIVPTEMRDGQMRGDLKFDDLAWDPAQTGNITLFGMLKKNLHPDADRQKWFFVFY